MKWSDEHFVDELGTSVSKVEEWTVMFEHEKHLLLRIMGH